MKVLGFVGGPHCEGNTVKLVEAVINGASEANHQAKLFKLCELKIHHIEEKNGKLFYPDDDFSELHSEIESMDALVIGTPIYYDHVDSRTKQFIDRMHYWSKTHGEEYRNRFPKNVRLINCITYAGKDENSYEDVLFWMKGRMEHYWGMRHIANLKAFDTRNKPVAGNKELLEKARRIGRSL